MSKIATRAALSAPNMGLTTHVPPQMMNALLTCRTAGELRSLAPLPEDAQRVIDEAVVGVGLERLVIVQDLLDAGLIYRLDDPLSVMEVGWDTENKIGHAQRVMLPDARGERQLPVRTRHAIPVYLTMDDWSLNIRTLRMSERIGAPLDTSLISQATRRVNEGLEDAIINGAGIAVGGNSAPGLLTSPVNTVAYTGNEAWDVAGHTGEEILIDVLEMIETAQADRKYGPYNLYVPTSYGLKLSEDFKANSSDTILTRLQQIESGGRKLNIRVADQLPANRTVLIQMTSDVIDMIYGWAPTSVTWTSPDGWNFYGAVIAIMVHRVKQDANSGAGIVVGNTT